MILTKVLYKGLTVQPYQIKENECFYYKNGKEIKFAYRLAGIPDYYVAGEGLHTDSTTSSVQESEGKAIFNSTYHYKVEGDVLTIR